MTGMAGRCVSATSYSALKPGFEPAPAPRGQPSADRVVNGPLVCNSLLLSLKLIHIKPTSSLARNDCLNAHTRGYRLRENIMLAGKVNRAPGDLMPISLEHNWEVRFRCAREPARLTA